MARFDFTFFDSGARWDSPDSHPTNMLDLTRFLENPFDDPDIGLAKLFSFSSDHLARMIANPVGTELATRITATASALTLVEKSATDDQTKKAIRKARKQVKNTFRKGVTPKVAMVYASVVAQYGPNSPEVAECFPQGRSIYSSAPDDRLAQHVETLKNGVAAHVADLGDTLLATLTALLAEWDGILTQSEASTGNATTSQQAKKLARENLQLMLFLNLLKLAEIFARQPEKLALYMQQSLLKDAVVEDDEEEPPAPLTPPIPPTPPAP